MDQALQATAGPEASSLVSLLGASRAAIVERLHRQGDSSVAELAQELGISEVAVRRHLTVLADEGLVEAELEARKVPGSRGRPPARYHCTPAAARLFPQGYDRFAAEVLDFLADTHGRDGLRRFLRWRLEREVGVLRHAVTAEDLHERLEQLASSLSAAGFRASVDEDGGRFSLTQDHCAIYDVAKDHPEVCAYEAATFSQVLGRDVILSRRETLAAGAPACVCTVTPRQDSATDNADQGRSSARRDEHPPAHPHQHPAAGRTHNPGNSTSAAGRGDHQ